MKYIFIIIFFLFTISCSKPKTVFICGDHICVNKAEARQYFEENLTLEVKVLKEKDSEEPSLIELNLNKTNLDNKQVIVNVSKTKDNEVILNILDEGQGFKEKDTNKIFNRFYSNRPDKFGQHSGLGLNIVKNLVNLHNARIRAFNRIGQKGASVEIIFPKI